MDDIIQYLIYGLLFYYFFLGGKKKKPVEKRPEEQGLPRQQTSSQDEEIEYSTEPVSTQQTGSDDLLKEVEKILGLPPRPETTTRAEIPEVRRRIPDPEVQPAPKIYRQEDFSIRKQKITDPVKASSHAEFYGNSEFHRKIIAFDYDKIPNRSETGVHHDFAKDLRDNLKKKKNLQEMFIFSEIINRPGRHRRFR
ncbi:MAG: hypothetical protein HRU80_11060 [Ignavibacteriales bacterium]|nr:hypothetical protein [Ignavibacteriaceae bacterium]QOJ29391.1 MAG: hypothetical protein HRU80_11060 [Ignavibacteriales bacterium]